MDRDREFELLEQAESWAEGYGAMSESCKSLMAALLRIKLLAERTDVPAGDLLYEIVCEVEAGLEDAPKWDSGIVEDEPEAAPLGR